MSENECIYLQENVINDQNLWPLRYKICDICNMCNKALKSVRIKSTWKMWTDVVVSPLYQFQDMTKY